jgi:hypothetical protein
MIIFFIKTTSFLIICYHKISVNNFYAIFIHILGKMTHNGLYANYTTAMYTKW